MDKKLFQDIELNVLVNDNLNRLNSRNMAWELCRKAFEENKDKTDDNTKDFLALHLQAFLASFGMLRGSTFLLKFCNYTVHIGAVDILLKSEYKCLFGANFFDDNPLYDLLNSVYSELFNYYQGRRTELVTRQKELYYEQTKESHIDSGFNADTQPKPTLTLITKILLGVYGCCPAYDDLGKKGMKQLKINVPNNNDVPNLKYLVNSIKEKGYFAQVQEIYNAIKNNNKFFTYMRALDIFLWTRGKGSSITN